MLAQGMGRLLVRGPGYLPDSPVQGGLNRRALEALIRAVQKKHGWKFGGGSSAQVKVLEAQMASHLLYLQTNLNTLREHSAIYNEWYTMKKLDAAARKR